MSETHYDISYNFRTQDDFDYFLFIADTGGFKRGNKMEGLTFSPYSTVVGVNLKTKRIQARIPEKYDYWWEFDNRRLFVPKQDVDMYKKWMNERNKVEVLLWSSK